METGAHIGGHISGQISGWKAIASFLGCSVRTAQRWERLERLPVHRQRHKIGATPYLVPLEVTSWRGHPLGFTSGYQNTRCPSCSEIGYLVEPNGEAGTARRFNLDGTPHNCVPHNLSGNDAG